MVKTKYRNRFTSNHISSLLHVKQGLTDGCTSFNPTTDMLKVNKFSNNDYTFDLEYTIVIKKCVLFAIFSKYEANPLVVFWYN